VDGHLGFDAAPDGFYHRVCRFNGKIDGLISLILIEDDRGFRESGYALFDHILEGTRKFHGYRVGFDPLEKVPDRACEF
jgi:hypothetical protein